VQLKAALKRIGAEIVKESVKETEGTIFLRVDPDQGAKWIDAVTSFLLGAEGKPFTPDISKYFFANGGSIRYLWRMHLTGDVSMAMTFFGSCAIEAAHAHAPEINSFPLVGRATYTFDPAKGKIKGGHDLQSSSGILNMAIGGVGGVS
jgi:hypothetical protein